ncbi:MAG: serine/threonine protein kinase, partial [Phycisphaerales bacterium]
MADDTPMPKGNGADEFETEPLSHSPDSRFGPSTAAVDPMPERIGDYRIIEEVGRGGVGVVYLAEKQSAGVRTRVALKVLKRGMDTDDLLRRFELERQLLAALDHPNIARLLDAGATEDGRPYFVMEHIKGRPLDRYCDENRLSIRQRLELFKQICSAVQFAHQNLVVHRDIKPGNILVTDSGQPKLVDFGIAKLLNPNLSPVEYEPTAAYVRLMTPEYASPEQVRGDQISTSSDIYSLGVVLFELLTGKRPYRLPSRVLDEVRRIICEEEPERPSTAVTKLEPAGAKAPTSAPPSGPHSTRGPSSRSAAGGTTVLTGTSRRDTERLARRLTGDLDNIVLKALRKEPNRRYPSAEQFALDIQRHLEGFPVTARPDTASYRARKFIQRHRAGVTAASLVAASLLIGLIGTTYYARESQRALHRETIQRENADRL